MKCFKDLSQIVQKIMNLIIMQVIYKFHLIETEMHKNDRQQSRSPQHSGQGVIKSQKNINISAAFHLKTQMDRGDDDHHRSPDIGRSEMRDTWRRPKIPYNKLGEVFNSQKQKKKYGMKTKQDMLQNLDRLVQNSQYKEAQKYLQPLNLKEQDKKKQSNESRNPFNPAKKMMKMVNKINEQIKQMQQMSVDRFRNRNGPKISQCVTLEVIKRSHNTGTVKKMIHVPSLTLVCIRQEPYTAKQSRNFIRDWTNIWRQKLSGQNMPFVTIHEVLYNYPEGALSIFMQYFKSRSLLNLLDLTATLPQSVIRQIFSQLLKILDIFYINTGMHFGGMSPSQIMFTDENKVKLNLGLFYHIPNIDSYNIYHIKAVQKANLFDFSNTLTRFMRSPTDKTQNLQIQRSVDIFKVGLCMLQCAIGSFENYEQSPIVFQAVKYIFTEQGQRLAEIDNLCCLIHSQSYLLQMNQTNLQTERVLKKQDKFINYLKLLKDRFSIHFINFLCSCLKLQHGRRSTLNQLNSNGFIVVPHDNDNRTVKVDLSNMLAIGKGWNQQIFQSGTQQKLDSFLIHLKDVLQNCSKETLNDLITLHQDKIYSLGKEVGFNSLTLGNKLQRMITQLIKSGK